MKNISLSMESLEPFFRRISQLTKLQRILICIGTAVVILGIFGYFLYMPKFDAMSDLREEIKQAESKLERTKAKARTYAAVKKEFEEAQAQFRIVARALPDKEEIPSLLTGISQAGKASGLKFVLFQPQDEATKDFYAEIPVKMELTGQYHDLGVFFDKLARLSRIVNVRDFTISGGSEGSGKNLKIACTAVTYKFIESSENQKSKKKR